MWWHVLIGVGLGMTLLYAGLLFALWAAQKRNPHGAGVREALRLLPDVLRLLRRLARDPEVPRGVRIRLVLLLVYLASPIDVIPDFIPVLGYADDAIVVAVALRSVVRRAGSAAIARHWPGTSEGLRLLERAAGLQHEPVN